MDIIKQIEAIAEMIRPSLTINLIKLLEATDELIESATKIAKETNDFSEVEAHCLLRTAIIDVMDERDSNLYDNYSRGMKVGA
jgi:hypothetical protein